LSHIITCGYNTSYHTVITRSHGKLYLFLVLNSVLIAVKL
jgi:hypothetical protein